MQLLQSDEPSPVRVLRTNGASDLFLAADHAGRLIPRSLDQLGLPDSEIRPPYRLGHRHRRRHRAPVRTRLMRRAILQTYSRLVIDCNRDPDGAELDAGESAS